ncbi:hypothetical protein [Streptosporangium sp. NPDC006930]|uniref:hypothetical protein n=1 Tax=unclassified Streptosporangium TaxID=2632669 RepID=UPI003436571B
MTRRSRRWAHGRPGDRRAKVALEDAEGGPAARPDALAEAARLSALTVVGASPPQR